MRQNIEGKSPEEQMKSPRATSYACAIFIYGFEEKILL